MNIVSTRLARRLGAYRFCQQKMLSPFTIEAPIKHRVMATNQWPAPYYQRLFRSYPIRKEHDINLIASYKMQAGTWWLTKQDLKSTLHGRKVLDHAENRIKTDTFLIYKQDSSSLIQGYVSDIAQFMDMAQKENRRILQTTNLL